MKPTLKEIQDASKKHCNQFDSDAGRKIARMAGFKLGVDWAISLQPEWVQIESLLTVIENGLSEHIALLKEINKGNQYNNVDMWDYQTAAESNEAIIELRRLFTPQPPTK